MNTIITLRLRIVHDYDYSRSVRLFITIFSAIMKSQRKLQNRRRNTELEKISVFTDKFKSSIHIYIQLNICMYKYIEAKFWLLAKISQGERLSTDRGN